MRRLLAAVGCIGSGPTVHPLHPTLKVTVALGCGGSLSLIVCIHSRPYKPELFFLAGLGSLNDMSDFEGLQRQAVGMRRSTRRTAKLSMQLPSAGIFVAEPLTDCAAAAEIRETITFPRCCASTSRSLASP